LNQYRLVVVGIPKQLSLRGLLVWLAVLGTLVLLFSAALIGMRTHDVTSATKSVVEVYEPAAENVATLVLANSEMERGVSLYLLGETEEALLPFVGGERSSALALESLERLVAQDPTVGPLIDRAAAARIEWLEQVGRPAIKAVRDGNSGAADQILTSDESQQLYDELVTATATLSTEISRVRGAAFRDLAAFSDQLIWVLAASILGLLGSIFVAMLIMFRWVLGPLNDLRRQIRDVARRGSHNRPIVPTGPRELAAVGADAEAMRRQLVAEIDEARSAREALEHSAPLVTAIRRELSMAADPAAAGLQVHGEVQPAEGVLAGDWWDCVAMPSGEAAVIVTDISGHGPEAGVAAMRLKHLLDQSLASGSGPQEALSLAARTFADDESRFATVAIVCVDPETGAVRWANGGHHPPVLCNLDGEFRQLNRTGPLLSWIGGPWEIGETAMAENEYLLLFSDGLVESHDEDGEELQTDGLMEILQPIVVTKPEPSELVKQVLARARQRAVDWARDDVSLVAVALDRSSLEASSLATESRDTSEVGSNTSDLRLKSASSLPERSIFDRWKNRSKQSNR
jgi:serine phosphatase RsbU (regulator of sigma subunit)/CHASE3 domain sensor protein